jgi:molecular chaperone DnaK
VIKASGGLSEDDIKRMVSDAESHAEDDRKFRELVEVRNRADALLHTTEKTLKDLGEKVPPADRAKIESALADLKRVQGGDDKDVIETKAKALSEAAASLAQQAYADAGAGAGPAGAAGAGGNAGPSGGKDDVLDAEFEEVKDGKKGA